MMKKPLSYSLVHDVLAEDVFDEYNITHGKMLLPKGHRLRAKDIHYLQKFELKYVVVEGDEKKISQKLIKQINYNWDDQVFKEVYVELLSQVKYTFNCLIDKTSPDAVQEMMYQIKPAIEYSLKHPDILFSLHLIRGHDDYTCRHCLNVSIISTLIGHLLEMKTEEIFVLGQAALLHDIGKVQVDQTILTKPGPLSKHEFTIMKKHTEYGFEILSQFPLLDERILSTALNHHERLDGSGYPNALQEDQIPLFAQIVAVADTFDAICSDRFYKTKRSPYYAFEILHQEMAEHRFNPEVVSKFTNYMLSKYAGKKVRLSNKQKGEIVYVPPFEPSRPLIKLDNHTFIDLTEVRDLTIEEILQPLNTNQTLL